MVRSGSTRMESDVDAMIQEMREAIQIPRVVEVRIPGHPPGGNDLHRMNRFQVRKSREVWKGLAHQEAVRAMTRGEYAKPWMLTAVGRSGRSPESSSWTAEAEWWPLTRATIAVSWRFRVRRTRDLDNLIAGLKPIVDGLVSSGILQDDHSGVLVGFGPLDVQVGAEQDETVLTVTEVPG